MNFLPAEDGVFLYAFAISAFCGIAWLLRSSQPINIRTFLSALLNSGMLGIVVALLWFQYYSESTYFLLGICGLAGIGGVTIVDKLSSVVTDIFAKILEKRLGIKLLDDSGEPEEQSHDD